MRQVVRVTVDQGIADDDRAAVDGAEQFSEVIVLSAAALAAATGRDAGFVDAADRDGVQAVTSSRWLDRHSGTAECGSGIGPSTSTCATVLRSAAASRSRLSVDAGSYAVKPVSTL